MKPALLVVDIQNAWMDEDKGMKAFMEDRIGTVNLAARWFRKKKLPVVVVSHEDKESGAAEGTRPFEVVKGVDVAGGDIRVTKHYPNSFNKTALDSILRQKGCDTVVIAGLSASWCVLATFFGARDNDFKAYLLKDGVAAPREDLVRFAEEICETLDVDSFDKTFLS